MKINPTLNPLIRNTISTGTGDGEAGTDDGEGCGDFQVVTEAWIEPQCGYATLPDHQTASYMHALQYRQIPDAVSGLKTNNHDFDPPSHGYLNIKCKRNDKASRKIDYVNRSLRPGILTRSIDLIEKELVLIPSNQFPPSRASNTRYHIFDSILLTQHSYDNTYFTDCYISYRTSIRKLPHCRIDSNPLPKFDRSNYLTNN